MKVARFPAFTASMLLVGLPTQGLAGKDKAAAVYAVSKGIRPSLLKKVRFKVDVTLRQHGYSVLRRRALEDLPAADDPWLRECLVNAECVGGIQEQLGVDVLLAVVLEQEDGLVGGTLDAWRNSVHSGPLTLAQHGLAAIRKLLPDLVGLALQAMHRQYLEQEQPQVAAGREEPSPEITELGQPNGAPASSPASQPPKSGSEGESRAEALGARFARLMSDSDGDAEAPATVDAAAATPDVQEASETIDASSTVSATDCVDVFTETSSAGTPAGTSTAPSSGVFVKPRVLLLPPSGTEKVQTAHGDVFLDFIDSELMEELRLKRLELVVHCKKKDSDVEGHGVVYPRLDQATIENANVYHVEWVFAPALLSWAEKLEDKKYKMESTFGLRIYRVTNNRLVLDREESVSLPSLIDWLVFMAQDAAEEAKRQALEKVGSAVPGGGGSAGGGVLGKALDVVNKATRKSPEQIEYEYKLAQNLEMAGGKLALVVRNHPRFRLSSPIVTRTYDEVGVGVGESEGVSLNDTFVFSRGPASDWDGFGRISDMGPGGEVGRESPSTIELIGDYDGEDSGMQAYEYPLMGIQLGAVGGVSPIKHRPTYFATGDVAVERSLGVPAISIDVRFRIPWVPIAELYETNNVSYVLDPPLTILNMEFGLEKRWLWGRLAPLVGARYSVVSVGIPVPDPSQSSSKKTASAYSHGCEAYLGFAVYLHPVWTLQLQGGYRYFSAKVNQFTLDKAIYFARDVNGEIWEAELSGPVLKLAVSYEL